MTCSCGLSPPGRWGALGAIVWPVVLAAPMLAALLYWRSDGLPEAGARPVWAVEPASAVADVAWADLATSSLKGRRIVMSELGGKPTILYFWATWCPLCQVQRELLSGLSVEWKDRVRVAGLTADEDIEAASRYLDTHPSLEYELRASSELLRRFDVSGLPTLVVVDAEGRVRGVTSGLTEANELRVAVAPLLSPGDG